MSQQSLGIREPTSVYERLKAEFLSVLPAVVFFFLALNFINLTHQLLFHQLQISAYRQLSILLGAAVAGKVLAAADLLPIMNVFPGKPLIYATLWKTSIYSLGILLYRYCDFLAPFIFQYKDLSIGLRQGVLQVDWYWFWGIQLWVFVLLFVYVAAREAMEEIGGVRMRQLFFGF